MSLLPPLLPHKGLTPAEAVPLSLLPPLFPHKGLTPAEAVFSASPSAHPQHPQGRLPRTGTILVLSLGYPLPPPLSPTSSAFRKS